VVEAPGAGENHAACNINITHELLPASTSPTAVAESSIRQFKQLLDGFVLDEKRSQTINGNPSCILSYHFPIAGLAVHQWQLIVIVDRHAYAITCNSEASVFSQHSQAYSDVFSSFAFE